MTFRRADGGRLPVVPQQISDAGRGQPAPGVVGHHDLMRGQRPAQMDGCCCPGDQTCGNSAVMGCPDLDPERMPVCAGMDSGGKGTKRFGEDHVCAAMQDSGNLGVAFDGHRADDPLSRHFREPDAHLDDECTYAVWTEPFMHIGGNTGIDQFLREAAVDGGDGFIPGEIVAHEN